jgi:hypothetical protein
MNARPSSDTASRKGDPVKTYLFSSCFISELEALRVSFILDGATCADIQKITIHGEARYTLKVTR